MRGLVALSLATCLTAAPLETSIERLLEGTPAARGAFWGIEVVDLATGRTLYARNADRLFTPASNMKLFTAALALERLGPDFRFRTRVLADASPAADGVIHGPVRLVGGGDPNLSARAVPYRKGPVTGDPLGPLEDLADQVVARGVTRIEGGVIGDDTWYLWEPYPDGWAVDDLNNEYGAPVSALTINDNALKLTVHPADRAGDPASLTVTPAIEFFQIDNRVRTVAAGGERKIVLERQPGSGQVRLWGTIPARAPAEALLLAIDDPAEYAARAFSRALENRGITVAGPVRAQHRFANEDAGGEAAAFELAHRDSAPLLDDLGITAKVSQNLHAELALRAVGRARRDLGSRQAGLQEMKAFLGEIAIAPEAYSFGDGSGLDRADLVTPAAVVKLLRHMYDSPLRDPWIALLPVGGQEGTLIGRFGENGLGARIHAKTGTLSHVAALSGYAERPGGHWMAFAILVNNFNGVAPEIRGIIDRICTLIGE